MDRRSYIELIRDNLRQFPVVALVGSRQVGKTTLARDYCRELEKFDWDSNYIDLEDPSHRARLSEPMRTLGALRGLVVIDEVQHSVNLFEVLRVLADREDRPAKFLVLGSASGHLLRQTSESLAGRISYIEVDPIALSELDPIDATKLWIRGGYPPSFLAGSQEDSVRWRDLFIQTFLHRDIPTFGVNVAPPIIERLWSMIAHRHAQVFNASELAKSLGVSQPTVQRYVDILSETFVVQKLRPWFTNLEKRHVRSPKIYIRDSGLLHRLLRIGSQAELERHPSLGASWEGFALEQVLKSRHIARQDAYFWAVHEGAEMDLVVQTADGLEGYEFKYGDAPRMTKSIASAIQSLDLKKVSVVYPGTVSYPVSDIVDVVSIQAFGQPDNLRER